MSRLLIVLLATAGIAHADCYTRGATVSSIGGKIERVADYQYSLLPAPAGTARCRVTFRALINDRWYTAEGETAGSAVDMNQGVMCATSTQDVWRVVDKW